MNVMQILFQAAGLFLILMVPLQMILGWKMFSWVKKNHPKYIPNPNGLVFEISNIGFLFLILLPQKGAVNLFPEKRALIYTWRAMLLACLIVFLPVMVFLIVASER